MISRICGILLEEDGDSLTIDLAGLGLEVLVPSNQLHKAPNIGEKVELFTHLVWRDTGPLLLGFFAKEDIRLYKALSGVSGIGTRLALNLMGFLPRAQLARAIIEGQSALLIKAPGLGKKTAQRLTVELKETLIKLIPSLEEDSEKGPYPQEAVAALTNLGYSVTEAITRIELAMQKKPKGALSDLISQALKEKIS